LHRVRARLNQKAVSAAGVSAPRKIQSYLLFIFHLRSFEFERADYGSDSECYTDYDDYYTASDADYYSDADDSTDDTSDDEPPHPCYISAFTVVGDSQIWVSTVGTGTYYFDTVSREWSKVGAWALPFRGRAVFLPEHNLWFGISDDGYQLCAVDLALTQPVQQEVREDPPPPQVGSLTPTATHLLPLGFGKLCVARLFQETEQGDGAFAVVTGVEVRRGAGTGNLQVVKHKSRRYSFGKYYDDRLL
jgi:hypothetical protein